MRFAAGKVHAGEHAIDFATLALDAHAARISLSATGFYRTPKIHWDRKKHVGRPFFYFAYGDCCASTSCTTSAAR